MAGTRKSRLLGKALGAAPEGLGARRVGITPGEVSWVALADPDGTGFCVLRPLPADSVADQAPVDG